MRNLGGEMVDLTGLAEIKDTDLIFVGEGCDVEPITVEKSHICGNYQYFVKLIRRLGAQLGYMQFYILFCYI